MKLKMIAKALDDKDITEGEVDKVMQVGMKLWKEGLRAKPFMVIGDARVYWISTNGFINVIQDAIYSEYFTSQNLKDVKTV